MNYEIQRRSLYYKEDNKKYLFVPVQNIKSDNEIITDIYTVYENLPNTENIDGKILTNTDGYNISGWWKYITVKKKDLIYE